MLAATPPPQAGPPLQNGAAESSSPSAGASAKADASPDATSQKKTYLSLLPPAQIIEICLLFEPHVPLQVKSTVWPADLEAAILELKKTSQPSSSPQLQPPSDVADRASPSPGSHSSIAHAGTPSLQVHPPGPPPPPAEDPEPPMGSLRNPAEEARPKVNGSDSGATTVAASSPAPPPAPTPVAGSSSAPSATAPSHSQLQPQAGPSQPPSVPPSHASTPQPQAQPQQANLHPPGPYPYAPYPYAVPQPQGQQTAYPHAPYYPPPPAYPSHYPYPPYAPPPGYPAPPPGHSPPPPPHGQHHMFSSNPLVRPPLHPPGPAPQPPPPPAEDLPSYEEMIVEALLDCGDSEGAAPKDLFTWMAARYPLQTNFRPSASQALQKAYKRGRLEKRPGGKYRLNPAWEGGATSKRTTRRPQTLAQTTYAMHHPQAQSSPFTHAPLQPAQHPPAPGAQPPYNGYPYSYPYSHYPGYPPHPAGQPAPVKAAAQPAPGAPTTTAAADSAAKTTGEEKDESGEGSDAWEAAQHILKAINFGGLDLAGAAASGSNESQSGAPAAGQPSQNAGLSTSGAGVPPPVTASHDADLSAVLSALVSAAGAAAPAEPPRATLTEDERAALQAQLALLAAQLTEIAEGEEDEEHAAPPPAPVFQTAPTYPAPSLQQYQAHQAQHPAPASAPAPVPQQPPSAPEAAQPPSQPSQPASQPAPQRSNDLPPPPIAAYSGGTHILLDINAFPEVFASTSATSATTGGAGAGTGEASAPASGHQTEVDELADDDSDDDDMEDVVVPLHPRSVRT
ncbi:hypothetical protein PYCCODRAFT_1473934 [Trametes coccinea BRFM310]|uniref:Histone H1 n=1 Tax=Trametes coccinea (strain BRFM310) TaxID=1353009 RepID=A0A1Y2J3B2_TRAC3|nr:hypothetical protein PYCCODRAFT_1473934 [Trametes coccinea BRFM310]